MPARHDQPVGGQDSFYTYTTSDWFFVLVISRSPNNKNTIADIHNRASSQQRSYKRSTPNDLLQTDSKIVPTKKAQV